MLFKYFVSVLHLFCKYCSVQQNYNIHSKWFALVTVWSLYFYFVIKYFMFCSFVEWFRVRIGFHQRSLLSPLSFITVISTRESRWGWLDVNRMFRCMGADGKIYHPMLLINICDAWAVADSSILHSDSHWTLPTHTFILCITVGNNLQWTCLIVRHFQLLADEWSIELRLVLNDGECLGGHNFGVWEHIKGWLLRKWISNDDCPYQHHNLEKGVNFSN